MAEKSKPAHVSCPQCGRFTLWTLTNAYRPFCSERCRTIDLGQWATESYRIPATESEPDQPQGKD
jgi:uncharacterized protein